MLANTKCVNIDIHIFDFAITIGQYVATESIGVFKIKKVQGCNIIYSNMLHILYAYHHFREQS